MVEEEKRVALSNPNQDFQVRCENLRKVYWEDNKPKVAVRNISFGLDFGDCFALLGVNGAGKTTTFKSLTRDVTPTKGSVHIAGLNIADLENFERARKMIGYCPQFDAIFFGMTVYEHLWFYARIKGIVPELRD